MFALALRILLACDGCDVREDDLMAKFGLFGIFVHGKHIASQDEVDRLPNLNMRQGPS